MIEWIKSIHSIHQINRHYHVNQTSVVPFLCVSGMAHILSVKVRPRVFVAKCSKPQAEGREAGVKEAV